MVGMATVTGLTGELAVRHAAQTAVVQAQLTVLALAYDQHVTQRAACGGASPHCGHASEPPYIVIAGAEERAWCSRCVKGALSGGGSPCEECRGETAIYMHPFGEIVVAADICQDCGGDPRRP